MWNKGLGGCIKMRMSILIWDIIRNKDDMLLKLRDLINAQLGGQKYLCYLFGKSNSGLHKYESFLILAFIHNIINI